MAYRRWDAVPGELASESLEQGLVFVGLVAMIDPPRPEVAEAVRLCKTAGITPVMVTGDHPATARAIAARLGILAEGGKVVTGQQMSRLAPGEFERDVKDVRVYARVDPAQKIMIVAGLQAKGEFVAMTGDGVNDAPAIKRAEIGVAMGKIGTDVSREASSMVLLDDNFATIVSAVREGRRIYDNIRKFIRYVMAGQHRRDRRHPDGAVPRHADPAAADPDPVGQPGDRRPAGARAGDGAGGAHHHAARAAPAGRERLRARHGLAGAVDRHHDRRRSRSRCSGGR